MINLPLQTLERANFTEDSNEEESTRRVTLQEKEENETNDTIRHTDLLAVLSSIECKLDRISFILEGQS